MQRLFKHLKFATIVVAIASPATGQTGTQRLQSVTTTNSQINSVMNDTNYNAAGLVISRQVTVETASQMSFDTSQVFTYDSDDRLTQMVATTMGPFGLQTEEVTYVYSDATPDVLQSIISTNTTGEEITKILRYDTDGRLTGMDLSSVGGMRAETKNYTLQYNAENQVVAMDVTHTADGATNTGGYTVDYDDLGRPTTFEFEYPFIGSATGEYTYTDDTFTSRDTMSRPFMPTMTTTSTGTYANGPCRIAKATDAQMIENLFTGPSNFGGFYCQN